MTHLKKASRPRMSKRAASLVQADYDRGVAALVKVGVVPSIVYDIERGTVTIGPAVTGKKPKSDWKSQAPERV